MSAAMTALFVNEEKPGARELAASIVKFIHKRQGECKSFNSLHQEDPSAFEGVTHAISLGGDGTVLATARQVAKYGIPIFPVNLGNFGFITEVGVEDWSDELGGFLDNEQEQCNRLMIDCIVLRSGVQVFRSAALNDAVVAGAGISKIISLHLSLSQGQLGRYRADGMIVATPTGSTAYSAAAGGPILHPEMDAMILNPICPFTLSHRPIVLPSSEVISMDVMNQQRTALILTIDGQVSFPLNEGDHIKVLAAKYKAKIAFSKKRNFYDVLRTKLNWSGGPDA